MTALNSTHADILIAIIGGLALVLVALIPSMKRTERHAKRTADSIGSIDEHMPPNGLKMYEMIEDIHTRVSSNSRRLDSIQTAIDQAEGTMVRHLEHHVAQERRSKRAKEAVE